MGRVNLIARIRTCPCWLHRIVVALLLLIVRPGCTAESDYYRLVTYPVPDELKLEVSGIAALPDGRMAVAIRKGEIWFIDGYLEKDPSRIRFHRFASGLHEPLGLSWHQGALYTVQRTELTRLRDLDADDIADEYWTVANQWGVSGNYHEYAYGPVFDPAGNAWVTLNCTIGDKVTPTDRWRGWSLKIQSDGTVQPISGGFRSPSGIGLNAAGDVFATDQQGNWFGTCALVHIQQGAFHGHADALKYSHLPGATIQIKDTLPQDLTVAQAAHRVPQYRLPAVWMPYRKMGMSSTDILCDTTEGKFGPFANQLFIGEFTMSMIVRVCLEKVHGQYQGACFRFREGFQSAVLRMGWAPDHSMMIGQSNRGWNSLGTRSYGLQRLVWTGKVPFEVKAMKAKHNGFELEFTQPVSAKDAAQLSSYQLSSYTYHYHATYGSDEIDTHSLQVKRARVSQDGLRVTLTVEGLREGYVHELKLAGVRSQDGRPLLHDLACYTLNRIP